MNSSRRQFVKLGCACLVTPWVAGIAGGCESTRYISGTMESNGISIPINEFVVPSDPSTFREYVIVRNEQLEYPICVYRFSDKEYTALLMKCTHQGTELQVAGDQLHCPAHGSEYSNSGKVTQGPATDSLRVFHVTPVADTLLIALK